MPGLEWHRCGRWSEVGIACPFAGLDEFEEPDEDEPKDRVKTPIPAVLPPGKKEAKNEARVPDEIPVLDIVEAAEAIRKATPFQPELVPSSREAATEAKPTFRMAPRGALGPSFRSIPGQLSSTAAALARAIQQSARRTESRSSSSTAISKTLQASFAAAVGATAVAVTAGGRGPRSGPPSATAELRSTAVAESALAKASAKRRVNSRRAEEQRAVEEAERVVKEAGARKRAGVLAASQQRTADRNRKLRTAAVAAVVTVAVGAGVRSARGSAPAGGGFHMRDVIRPRTKFAF